MANFFETLLTPDYMREDKAKYEPYGPTSLGTPLSMYNMLTKEEDRNNTIAGGVGGIGALVNLLAYLKSSGALDRSKTMPSKRPFRPFDASAYSGSPGPVYQAGTPESAQMQQLLNLLYGTQTRSSYNPGPLR